MYKNINNKLGITETHLSILSLFTKGFQKGYYIREVQKLLGMSPRTAQLVLEDLERKTILESKLNGKIKTYQLKNTLLSRYYLILAEQYKLVLFLNKNALLREIIGKSIPTIQGTCIIFGSYAKGTAMQDSDLDVFIVGTCNKKHIEDIGERYNIDVRIKQYTTSMFKKNVKKDIFLREIIDNHVILSGADQFINAVIPYG